MAFWDGHDEIARELSGAHHSSWNERTETVFREFSARQINDDHTGFSFRPDPAAPGNGEPERRRSAVQWTGTIRLDQERVVDALDEMLELANDQEFDDTDLVRWKTALRAVLQAHGHLLSPAGQDYADGQRVNRHGWTHVIDRGVTEAWARHDLHRFIDRLGLPERLTERLKQVDAEYDDPVATAAAERLVSRIAADHPTADYEDVLRTLNSETPAGKLPRAARLVFEADPLAAEPLPEIVTQAAADRIEDTLLSGLSDTTPATHEADRRGDVPVAEQLEAGARIGDETYAAARRTTAEIAGELRTHGTGTIAEILHAQSMSTAPADGPPLSGRRPQNRFQQQKARPDRGAGL